MLKKIITFAFTVVGIIIVVGALVGTKLNQFATMGAAGAAMVIPPETVTAATARDDSWETSITATGTITAVQGVTVSAEMAGKVVKIAFESGSTVQAGELLVQLDTSVEEAQLRAADAASALAKLNLVRARTLRENNTNSQADLDGADAQAKQAEAQAENIRAVIAKKTIRAPFAGRLGLRQVNLGQYLETAKPIVSLQSLHPVYAEFSLPQQELGRLKTGLRVRLSTDAYPGRAFSGTLTAINPDLDQVTRSVRLQATFDNADHSLRPGMFARMEVLLPEEQTVLVIPATSVLSAPFGDSVYVIESKPAKEGGKAALTVRQQFIRSGSARGDFLSVESGLKLDDRIVSAGIFKLRNGMSVVESTNHTMKSSEAPRPVDS